MGIIVVVHKGISVNIVFIVLLLSFEISSSCSFRLINGLSQSGTDSTLVYQEGSVLALSLMHQIIDGVFRSATAKGFNVDQPRKLPKSVTLENWSVQC